MGIDTKGVIITDKKDFWQVSQQIGHAIYKSLPNMQQLTPIERMRRQPNLEIALQSFSSLNHEPTQYIKFVFNYNGEDRILNCHLDCDSDLKSQFGSGASGIIVSLGHWGSSVEIMESILSELKQLGDCYILEMDHLDNWRQV